MNILQAIIGTEDMARNKKGPLPKEVLSTTRKAAESVEQLATGLSLKVTANTARHMLGTAKTSEDLHRAITQLGNTLFMEMDQREFYGPQERFQPFFEQPNLFGDTVFANFPSANEDIYEAGTCLALERGTACVMHLMRVLEVGLAALAKTVGVPSQTDWGAYIRKIQNELDARTKVAGKRSADEQFYAEAAESFDRLRRAFRNPTMHADKSYSPERAEEILVAVKAFMVHLSGRISE
jgi:hypothetical protein